MVGNFARKPLSFNWLDTCTLARNRTPDTAPPVEIEAKALRTESYGD